MTSKEEDRARRLAEALRDNLRRRKAQARGEPLPAPDTDRDTDADSTAEAGSAAEPISPSSRAP